MDHKKVSSFFDKKKQGGEGLSDLQKRAKSGVLKDLQSRASKAMSSKLQGLSSQKPVVEKNAEDSHLDLMGKGSMEESQSKSLPHSLLGEHTEHEAAHEDAQEEAQESPSEESAEEGPALHPALEHMSEEELDHHIEKLMAHKHSLKSRH